MNVALLAYLDNNIGDDLMIKIISEKYSDVTFYIYSGNNIVEKTFLKYRNIQFRLIDNLNKDLSKIDVIISLGGSIFIIENLRDIISRIFKLKYLIKAKISGKPVLSIGCNFGPFSKLGKLIARFEIYINNLIIVRDDEYRKLYENKKSKGEVIESSDFVFNLKINNIKLCKKDKILGISAYRSIRNSKNNYSNYEALAKLADKYIEENSGRVKLFAFDSEMENDLSAAHHIQKLIVNKNNVDVVPYLGDMEEFINEIATCEFLVCIRFHSAILAEILKIPFYPIAYSNKMANLINRRYPLFKLKSISELNTESNIVDDIFESITEHINMCGLANLPDVGLDYYPGLDRYLGNKRII